MKLLCTMFWLLISVVVSTAQVPHIERYAAIRHTFTARPGTLWVEIRMVAGGGAGASTSNQHFIPPSQYGQRGEDTLFGLRPAQGSMFAMTPTGVDCYVSGPPSFKPGQPIVIRILPPGVTGLAIDTPYYPINVAYLAGDVTKFNISATPFSPPFGGQSPVVAGPIGTNPSLEFHRVWFGVQGGGGGGIIGDQGTPLGSWGFDEPGPNGEIQGEAYQGGTGLGDFRIGPAGGVNFMGGNAGSAYQDFGIAGVNLTGAGGGGAPPPVGTTAPGEWAGSSGAAGGVADLSYVPVEGFIPWFQAGKGGLAQPPGPGGYIAGNGGHGMVRFRMIPGPM